MQRERERDEVIEERNRERLDRVRERDRKHERYCLSDSRRDWSRRVQKRKKGILFEKETKRLEKNPIKGGRSRRMSSLSHTAPNPFSTVIDRKKEGKNIVILKNCFLFQTLPHVKLSSKILVICYEQTV